MRIGFLRPSLCGFSAVGGDWFWSLRIGQCVIVRRPEKVEYDRAGRQREIPLKADALEWLLEPRDPPIRLHTLTDILYYPPESEEVVSARKTTLSYRPVRKIMRAQTGDGYWPPENTCYTPKWTATVWPLMLLGEMGVPSEPWMKKACERFFSLHQMENGAFSCLSNRSGRRLVEEPCLTGNMIRTLIVFGYGVDPRVRKALDWMPEHQLEDGGWNCNYPDRKVWHSSFMSTIEPLWAYSEIPRPKWTRRLKRSMERGAEFLLMHRLYKADHHDWRPIDLWGETPTKFHFPMYYYYDVLHGLRVLSKLGYGDDERMRDAVYLALSKKTPGGKWLLEGDWVRERKDRLRLRKTLVNLEQLMEPSKWITLNCYRVLAETGDLQVPKKFSR